MLSVSSTAAVSAQIQRAPIHQTFAYLLADRGERRKALIELVKGGDTFVKTSLEQGGYQGDNVSVENDEEGLAFTQ